MQRISEVNGYDPDCALCDDGWVCENHPDKSWPRQCECGAGMPCICNPLHSNATTKPSETLSLQSIN